MKNELTRQLRDLNLRRNDRATSRLDPLITDLRNGRLPRGLALKLQASLAGSTWLSGPLQDLVRLTDSLKAHHSKAHRLPVPEPVINLMAYPVAYFWEDLDDYPDHLGGFEDDWLVVNRISRLMRPVKTALDDHRLWSRREIIRAAWVQ